ncbi:MAG: phosphatidate cytidylyltransferase [Acidobacteria bacterium]|nr:phosphatidate cytidylyltransferase [Acidobacteriota bacterium]
MNAATAVWDTTEPEPPMRRIFTAVILIPLVVYPVLYGPLYLLVGMQLLCTVLGLWEAFRLLRAISAPAMIGFPLMEVTGYPGGLLFALVFSQVDPSIGANKEMMTALVVLSSIASVAILALALTLGHEIRRLSEGGATFLAVMYVAVPLGLLVWVWRQPDGPFHLLFALVVIWTSDTAGYFIGKKFGKHKSSPRISPNKTWEGTIASFVAALLVGYITARYFWGGDDYFEPMALAAFLNVAGQLGDLAESGLKRRAGVKDSSNLIPGHGGVLDRIDALLFAAPVLWYYWMGKTF